MPPLLNRQANGQYFESKRIEVTVIQMIDIKLKGDLTHYRQKHPSYELKIAIKCKLRQFANSSY